MSDYISADNLVLILKWLPVKSLMRLRCVCKGWKEIIGSAFFLQEHFSVQRSCLFVDHDGPGFLAVDPHSLPSVDTLRCPVRNREMLFWGTHHGIICLYDADRSSFLLWNPAIRVSMYLLLPTVVGYNWRYIEVQESCFGFWVDPVSKEFKFLILNLLFELDDDDEPVDVVGILYSSIKRDLKVITPREVGNWKPQELGPAVMIEGVGYWNGYKQKDDFILSFDFVQERFGFIEMPEQKQRQVIHCKWQDTLSLVCWDELSPHRCDIFLWQQCSWVNLFGFNLPSQIRRVFWVLGEKERVKVLAETRLELVLYDARTGFISLKDNFSDAFVAYDFVESLLCPHDFILTKSS